MLAYLIDPVAKTVTEVQHDESNEALYTLLDCRCYEINYRAVGLSRGDALYVDQEPYLRPNPDKRGAFVIKGQPQPMIGRGLISGHTADGEMCDPRTSRRKVRDLIVFL